MITKRTYVEESLHTKYYRYLTRCPDLPVYQKILANANNLSLLELACGDGRIIESLQSYRLEMTGLDISNMLLKRAKINCMQATILQGDMTNFSLGEKFDAIILGFKTFHVLLGIKAQLKMLQCVARHMKNKGVFFLHISPANPDKFKNFTPIRFTNVPDGILCRKTVWKRLDYEKKVFYSKVLYRFEGVNGLRQIELEDLNFQWIEETQLKDLLKTVNLIIEREYPCGCDKILQIKKQ